MSIKTYDIYQEFQAACHILDVDSEAVLRASKISLLTDNLQNLNVTSGQIATIFGELVMQYGKDDFHIKLADGFSKAAFGHSFLALQCSENLLMGIYRVARFKELIEPVRWHITEDDKRLSIELQRQADDFPLYGIGQIMSFLWLVKSCRNVSAKNIVPQRVAITDPAPHLTEISKQIGCEVEIADSAVIEFRLTDLEHRVLSVNNLVTKGLDTSITNTQSLKVDNQTFINLVYHIVNELLPSGEVSSQRVATRLSLSKRTLERRLSEQNTSLTDIVRHCRKDMAEHYLLNTHMPMTEITLMLGYRETTSFFRAFRSWFGCSLKAFKEGASRHS
ncbi:AraC family transcriptional regulator [Thiomicrospira cyclica]|uniref:Helix-turn-helix, AraC domain protein n=1 Tax=Thiomicrospira cyclica (strain DSM 14477 / JCM 11371 / ALM1) TaxID=717773 RepID=F6D8Y4_THICA|nr:AraC family transcriptional regulator [Thiomicrospira cyclica]AEG31984.1 Helix-turn-helix, AraC domain protein [Thiomicrospira cyclica ALM1]